MKKYIDILFDILYKITPFGIKFRYLKRITEEKDRWSIYDSLEIPGFGTNLVRFLFPIYSTNLTSSVDSISPTNTASVISFLTEFTPTYLSYFDLIDERIDVITKTYPFENNESDLPCINNQFFGVFDAAILQSMLKKHQPKNYIEIGSGISTKYARAIISEEDLKTKIISIDPVPRVEIKKLCDELFTKPLESAYQYLLEKAQPGDIVFMDGSHYVFPNNDTVVFFFQIINGLPKGVIVHIHDIYLPSDYPAEAKKQLWAENYLLLAWILGGGKHIAPLFPAYFINQTHNLLSEKLADLKIIESTVQKNKAYSFWFKIN